MVGQGRSLAIIGAEAHFSGNMSAVKARRLSGPNRLRASLLALVAGISCGHLTDPPLPENALPLTPPPVYAGWWAMVEACSGIDGSLEGIHWFSTLGQLQDPNDNADAIAGYWSLAGNRIVLSTSDTIAGGVVRHEMLHALLRSTGHPRSAFLQACGGVVACGQACVRDAGPPTPPASGTPTIAPSGLEVTTAVSPATPSTAIDGGLATFTISVRNPFSHSVIVALSNSAGGVPVSYGYTIRDGSGGVLTNGDFALDIGVTYFAAGETKRDVIDFFVIPPDFPSFVGPPGLGPSGIALAGGTYSFQGDYGGKAAPTMTVVLSQ
jgi:hypothetical protein